MWRRGWRNLKNEYNKYYFEKLIEYKHVLTLDKTEPFMMTMKIIMSLLKVKYHSQVLLKPRSETDGSTVEGKGERDLLNSVLELGK